MGTQFPNRSPQSAQTFHRLAPVRSHWPTTISLPGKALDLRPQFLEAFLPHQFLKLTASAEFGVKFLRDQSAQRVETILTAGMPVALCFQKLLGS